MFLFDMSVQPPQPLVSSLPLYIDNPGVPVREDKKMPVVLLVPSCRGSYPNAQQNLTFISIVKTIMALTLFTHSKNTKLVTQE